MFEKISVIALAAALTVACSDAGSSPSNDGAGATSAATSGSTETTGGPAMGTTATSGTAATTTGGGGSTGGGASSTTGAATTTSGAGGATSGATTDGTVTTDGGATTGGGGATAGATSSTDAGTTGGSTDMEWLPSWATTIQSTEPDNLPPSLNDNTLRQFVWPTVSGSEIRIQLSNERGASAVDIQKVHIAMAATSGNPGDSGGQIDTSTDAAFTFSGMESVTIPAGETVWSDSLSFPLAEIELTAITMQFGSNVPSAITGHPGARTTSYIASGDAVAQAGVSGETRDRWYFIDAIEVMAPANAYAIAVLGDSITDGYGVLNEFARWPDFMTLKIQDDANIADTRSVLNFGMGANNLTSSGDYQDSGVVRFGRDVLKRDKIKWLIVLEGINDIVYANVQAQPIIDAYQEIIDQGHAKGILVYGSPMTPTDQGSASVRNTVNDWIRTSGAFDAVIELDKAVDPNDTGTIASQLNNDGLHPNTAGYEAMGNAVDLSLFYDATLQ